MTEPKKHDYTIQKETYERCRKTFKTIEENFGLNINVHAEEGVLEEGQIFLFNHFARFETAIPPYVIYNKTGAFSRIIADKELFSAGEALPKFMRSAGAVPNDLPGLLPFLAADILRGHKVVIFPEGGMIKDRRVMDDKGRFRIFSRTAMAFRKHHRGAAILGLTLDLFKRRIKDLHEAGDTVRLEHWRKSLEMESYEELLIQANKPTLIVPGTITFYPLRISDNILNKVVQFFIKKGPSQMAEEIAIEGNILLKDTDMDIRFGEPLSISKKWHWWEKVLLNKYFLSIDSLDDLFSLRHKADTWSEEMLAKFISKETDKIRDQYMHKIYQGITVNLAHIASITVLELIKQGVLTIPKADFHKLLYMSFKKLQDDPKIHLHSSLFRPRDYKELHKGVSKLLNRFLLTCKVAKLIKEKHGSYYFQEKISKEHDIHLVRLENPILVRANEADPVPQVKKAILKSIETLHTLATRDFAYLLFDDEIKDIDYNKELYTDARYEHINKQETITESTAPYLLPQKKTAKVGVLLVHGFLSSPGELREIGEKLHLKGHAVLGMRVSGHGTTPWDLNNRTCEEWQASVRRNYEILSPFCEKIVVIGFSCGGALALNLASTHPEKLAGVASVCTPLILKDKMMYLVPYLHILNRLFSLLPKIESLVPFRSNKSDYPKTNYANMPVSALNELRYLVQHVKKSLKYISTKTIIIQGTGDPIVNPKAANKIYSALHSKDKTIHMVETDRHGLIYDNVGETHKLLLDFVEDVEKNNNKEEDAS
ncbi:MAG: esterase/lipase/1-acyl-sn-glycerol-3-phosphate acyltransferase [Alphaproteobacteria bacterium]|jgi:esterase/lipase/1-acyl-sn-glycerol-3-phosphate acyltransferase